MRKPPETPPPPLEKRSNSDRIQWVREYKLITPLFGGSAEPNLVDEKGPIRGSTIRGQLRFWWRAMRGGQFEGRLSAMKEGEGVIWGTASNMSPIHVSITRWHRGTPFKKTHEEPYNYVTFPLREEGGLVQSDITFTLRLTFPEQYQQDVAAAVWAWETFGGIGARTRRGFGAFQCVRVNDEPVQLISPNQVRAHLQEQLERYTKGSTAWPLNAPHLSAKVHFRVTSSRNEALAVWRDLISALKGFRQYKPTGDPYGANLWPEANAIRQLLSDTEPTGVHKFPRAALGLPINFEMRHKRDRYLDKVVLKGKEGKEVRERYASPILLRPFACAGGYVGLAVLLDGSKPPPQLQLTGQYRGQDKEIICQLDVAEREVREIPPLAYHEKAMTAQDIGIAFLDYLQGD